MSSYHELIVQQVHDDRQREAQPQVPHGAIHEVSAEAVYRHLKAFDPTEAEGKLDRYRQFAARCRRVFASLIGHQAPALH